MRIDLTDGILIEGTTGELRDLAGDLARSAGWHLTKRKMGGT